MSNGRQLSDWPETCIDCEMSRFELHSCVNDDADVATVQLTGCNDITPRVSPVDNWLHYVVWHDSQVVRTHIHVDMWCARDQHCHLSINDINSDSHVSRTVYCCIIWQNVSQGAAGRGGGTVSLSRGSGCTWRAQWNMVTLTNQRTTHKTSLSSMIAKMQNLNHIL